VLYPKFEPSTFRIQARRVDACR